MYQFSIVYVPVKGQFTRLIQPIVANNFEHAKFRFLQKYGSQCLRIINIECH